MGTFDKSENRKEGGNWNGYVKRTGKKRRQRKRK